MGLILCNAWSRYSPFSTNHTKPNTTDTAAAEGLTLRAFGGDARALRRARLELKKVEIATLCEAVLEVRIVCIHDVGGGFRALFVGYGLVEVWLTPPPQYHQRTQDPEAGFMKKVAAAAATSTEEKGKKGQGKTRMATLLTLMEDDDVRVQVRPSRRGQSAIACRIHNPVSLYPPP